MKTKPPKRLEHGRVRSGPLASVTEYGMNGAFFVEFSSYVVLRIVCSSGDYWELCGLTGEPWEHVSVSVAEDKTFPQGDRCPTWEEMDFVKRMCWNDDETVLQFHVPRNQHVNYHGGCLHLWRPTITTIPLPPAKTVGPTA